MQPWGGQGGRHCGRGNDIYRDAEAVSKAVQLERLKSVTVVRLQRV